MFMRLALTKIAKWIFATHIFLKIYMSTVGTVFMVSIRYTLILTSGDMNGVTTIVQQVRLLYNYILYCLNIYLTMAFRRVEVI